MPRFVYFTLRKFFNSKNKQEGPRQWKYEFFFDRHRNSNLFFNYLLKFLSFSLASIENCTVFLIHHGIYTFCFPYYFPFPQPCPPKSNNLPFPELLLTFIKSFESPPLKQPPLLHSLRCTSFVYILRTFGLRESLVWKRNIARVKHFRVNTKAHELWVTGAVNFYSFLSIFLSFHLRSLE